MRPKRMPQHMPAEGIEASTSADSMESVELRLPVFLVCPDGSHFSMWDDQTAYFPGLVKWLKAVDAGQKRVTF